MPDTCRRHDHSKCVRILDRLQGQDSTNDSLTTDLHVFPQPLCQQLQITCAPLLSHSVAKSSSRRRGDGAEAGGDDGLADYEAAAAETAETEIAANAVSADEVGMLWKRNASHIDIYQTQARTTYNEALRVLDQAKVAAVEKARLKIDEPGWTSEDEAAEATESDAMDAEGDVAGAEEHVSEEGGSDEEGSDGDGMEEDGSDLLAEIGERMKTAEGGSADEEADILSDMPRLRDMSWSITKFTCSQATPGTSKAASRMHTTDSNAPPAALTLMPEWRASGQLRRWRTRWVV
ncbi:hypothetical protein LTR95_008817 [Oleoguttula sp. CCFEE 5521]